MLLDHLPPITKDRFWDAPIKVILATLLMCLVAPIELFSGTTLPVTLQTLVILGLGILLGPIRGGIAALLYLILGCLGLPVFAEGGSGVDKLWGPTGGFLVSFVIAAWMVGKMAQSKWGQSWGGVFLAFVLGHALILLLGFAWYGWGEGFADVPNILHSLLPGLGLKITFGTLLIGGLHSLIRFLIRQEA